MPDAAAAVAAPTIPVVTAPAAAPAAAKGKPETFAQTMERFGGFSSPTPDAVAAAPAAAAVAHEAPPAKGKKAAKAGKVEAAVAAAPVAAQAEAAPAVDKLAQLKALAAELEYEFDGSKVAVRERVEFRETKDKLRKQIEQQEAEVLRRLNEAKTQFSDKLTKAEQIEKAYESGDYDGIAKLLGPENWNALQEEMIAKISDPNYKRLRELERKEQQREAELEQSRQAEARGAQQRAHAQALSTHKANLSAQMKQSADPLVRELHDDPNFINGVIEIQRQNWDGSGTVSPEKAIKIAAQGFVAPLGQHMRTLYDKLHRVYGATPAQASAIVAAVAPTAEAKVEPTGKKNRTGVVPTAPDVASAPKTFKTKREKDQEFSRQLAAAIAEENLGIES